MLFRLSAKLGDRLHIHPVETLPPDPNPYADWSAHVFAAGRARYILLTNTPSLYTVVMPSKGITNAVRFLAQAADYLEDFICGDGFEPIFRQSIAPALADVRYGKALNRSVTGSMNDIVWQTQVILAQEQMSLRDLSRLLNQAPMSYLDHANPKKAFGALGTVG